MTRSARACAPATHLRRDVAGAVCARPHLGRKARATRGRHRDLCSAHAKQLLRHEVSRAAAARRAARPSPRSTSSSRASARAAPSRRSPGTGSCGSSRAPPGAADALQERRHRRRRVDLDDPVEVADVDAQLQVRSRRSRSRAPRRTPARPGAARRGQRASATRTVVPSPRRLRRELLDPRAAVAEHQPLLAAVQRGDHLGGVVERSRRSRA